MEADGHLISGTDISFEIPAVKSTAEEYIPLVDSPPPPPPSDETSGRDELPPQPSHAPVSLPDLRAKIIKQVEYYFSDENLPSDKFLMKQVTKDKEGFVSISLIASFRKMKRLTNDNALIVDALKESSNLVVSGNERKVKRLHPLPKATKKNDKAFRCCNVVVENLPDNYSSDNIRKIFGQVGSIKSIFIHDPHADEATVTKKAEKEKFISAKPVALISYETAEAAEKAVATLNDETDWRNGLRVQFEEKWKGYALRRKAWLGSNSERGSHNRVHVAVEDENINHSNEQCDDAPDNEDAVNELKERNARNGRNRTKAGKHRSGDGMGHGTTRVVEPSKPPPGPRMPDGTRGFTMGRGRPPISSTV